MIFLGSMDQASSIDLTNWNFSMQLPERPRAILNDVRKALSRLAIAIVDFLPPFLKKNGVDWLDVWVAGLRFVILPFIHLNAYHSWERIFWEIIKFPRFFWRFYDNHSLLFLLMSKRVLAEIFILSFCVILRTYFQIQLKLLIVTKNFQMK